MVFLPSRTRAPPATAEDAPAGTCINTGCRPTKTLIASAKVAEMARRAADYGIVAGPVSADMAAVHARVAGIVATAGAGARRLARRGGRA